MRFWKPLKIPGTPKVGVGVAVYLNKDPRQLPALYCLVQSLLAQTYANFRVRLVHDGPLAAHLEGQRARLKGLDPRVEWLETAEHKGQFGHPHRQAGVAALAK